MGEIFQIKNKCRTKPVLFPLKIFNLGAGFWLNPNIQLGYLDITGESRILI